MGTSFLPSLVQFVQKRKLLLLVVLGLAIVALIITSLPGTVTVTSNIKDGVITIDSDKTAQSSSLLTLRGKHTITVTKDNYYPSTESVDVAPFSHKELTVNLKPKSLITDLTVSSSPLYTASGRAITFCDTYKTSVCIDTNKQNGDNFVTMKTQLLIAYPNDTTLPPVFSKDTATNEVIVYNTNHLALKLTSNEGLDKPILIALSPAHEIITQEEVSAAIKDVIGSKAYQYYIQYYDADLSQYNTVPANSKVYWNEYGE